MPAHLGILAPPYDIVDEIVMDVDERPADEEEQRRSEDRLVVAREGVKGDGGEPEPCEAEDYTRDEEAGESDWGASQP